MKRIAPEWMEILVSCGVHPRTASVWSEIFAAVIDDTTFSAGDLDLQAFLPQVLHESMMLERLEESLSYSAARLCAVWPRRFPTLADARPFERNPEALANKVYGGRMGNTQSGDGWKFRGRGVIQVTGRDNYTRLARLTGMDLVNNPGLLTTPLPALTASVAWWESAVDDDVLGDVEATTRVVNGGTGGLAHREQLAALVAEALA